MPPEPLPLPGSSWECPSNWTARWGGLNYRRRRSVTNSRKPCASLRLLKLSARLMAPILGVVYRSVLGPADCSLHLVGHTGRGKSELLALGQQHHGASMHRLNLPGNWLSTGNSLESMAFQAKDAPLVIDDFKPGGAKSDIDRLHQLADRVFRAQGNWSGRGRCRADGSLRVPRPREA